MARPALSHRASVRRPWARFQLPRRQTQHADFRHWAFLLPWSQGSFRARFAGRELQPGRERDFALGFLSQFGRRMGAGKGGAPMGGALMGAGMGGTPMAMGTHAAGVPGTGMAGMAGAMDMTGSRSMTGALGMGGHAPRAGRG